MIVNFEKCILAYEVLSCIQNSMFTVLMLDQKKSSFIKGNMWAFLQVNKITDLYMQRAGK